MAMWHCPHCGTPQAETARCWVCRRSSTTCSTCRHFRASLAADVGWCALDRRRAPLTGLELRGCWTQPAASAVVDGTPVMARPGGRVGAREFVPLDQVDAAPPAGVEIIDLVPATGAGNPPAGWEARTTLFGDLDR